VTITAEPARAPESRRLARRTLFAFILTFIAARIMVLLIMVGRVPNLYFFLRGTHVHHLNYGIFLLVGVSAYVLFGRPTAGGLSTAALVYGVSLALTFDEFGMWLHLGGSYWQRASIDAVVLVAALLALIAFAADLRRFESRHFNASIVIVVAVTAFALVLYDASLRLASVAGPRLEALEDASTP